MDICLESAETDKLMPAMVNARAEVKGIAFNAENPQFKSGYAKLDAVINAITPALTKHHLKLSQPTYRAEDGVIMLRTRITHAPSGQWQQSYFPIIPQADHKNLQQAYGISQTYQQRRQILSLFGIFPENDPDDQDGEFEKISAYELAEIVKEVNNDYKIKQQVLSKTGAKSYEFIERRFFNKVMELIAGLQVENSIAVSTNPKKINDNGAKNNKIEPATTVISKDQWDTLEMMVKNYTDIAARTMKGLKINSLQFVPKDKYQDVIEFIENQKKIIDAMGK